ncbi:MAG: hypothetical protein WBG50_20840, partial [Desulfomonilaceae bacterium]
MKKIKTLSRSIAKISVSTRYYTCGALILYLVNGREKADSEIAVIFKLSCRTNRSIHRAHFAQDTVQR